MKSLYDTIVQRGEELEEEMIRMRRDFHQHPEIGWLEMRTASIVSEELKNLGYEVIEGRAAGSERMGVPSDEVLQAHAALVEEEEKVSLLEDVKHGYTAVAGILHCGEGPVVALRFDMDALPMQETLEAGHRPFDEGFASVHPNMMHACGHDCHTTIGLMVARILSEMKNELSGTVRLLFQPAEEGTRGAYSMVQAGLLEKVDYFLAAHVSQPYDKADDDLIPGSYGALATCKYKVSFQGRSVHAGRVPELGKNAVLAAAHAAVALSGIPRHSEGMSRINVGSIHGGNGTNVVPDLAVLTMEVRGETTKINDYMCEQAERICQAAADMTDCTCTIERTGFAPSQASDESLAKRIADLVKREKLPCNLSALLQAKNQDSEDAGFMMNRVQEQGGQAVYMRLVTKMASPQHTVRFDVDESVLKHGVIVFASAVLDLLSKKDS